MKAKGESEVAQSCPTYRPQGLQPTRLLCPWDSPCKNIGVGCHFLLQCMLESSEVIKYQLNIEGNALDSIDPILYYYEDARVEIEVDKDGNEKEIVIKYKVSA